MEQLEHLLLDALHPAAPLTPERLAAVTPEQWQAWLALARKQRVASLLWRCLQRKGAATLLPDAVATELKAATKRTALQNLCRYGELRQLLNAAQKEQIPVVLLKGIYLADAVYENPGLREMNDIDLLVPVEALQRTADILVSLGYEPLQPVDPVVTLKVCHHLPPFIKKGYANFEIHWNLPNPGEVGYVEPDGFLQRAVAVRVAGGEALALSPEDLLLHLCYHTSFHHHFAFGLRPSCDIAHLIEHFGSRLDWRIVGERATAFGWQRGVYLALLLARELVGATVPDAVLECLQPGAGEAAIVELARRQLFSDKLIASEITPSFAELATAQHLFEKIRIFWQRIFVSKEYLAAHYALPVDSPYLYLWYPRRVLSLLRRYRSRFLQMQGGDAQLDGIVTRKRDIVGWLEEKL